MFERFTERARQVVVLAQQEARNNKVRYIGPEHILVGIMLEEEGLAANVLHQLGIDTGKLREAVKNASEGSLVEEHERERGQIPFTPRAKKCLELALREALSLGHNYIGTEHILLGLVRESPGTGADTNRAVSILRKDFRLEQEEIRAEVIRMLSGPGGRRVGEQPKRPATAHEHDIRELQVQLEALKKTKLLQHMIESAVTLGRQYPERPAEAVARAVIALHD